jgi:hypothetical protein
VVAAVQPGLDHRDPEVQVVAVDQQAVVAVTEHQPLGQTQVQVVVVVMEIPLEVVTAQLVWLLYVT